MKNNVDELSQFKGTSIDSIKGVANEKGERLKRSGGRFHQLSDGKSVVRFLPSPVAGPPFYEATYHWINGEKVHCRRPLGDKCPVCNLASKIWKQFEEAKEEGRIDDAKNLEKQAKDLFAKNEYYFNALVRNKEEGDKVVVLQTGVSVKKEVTKLFFNEDYKDITDPIEGHDIVIEKSGKGKETRYSTTARPQKTILAGTLENKADAAKLIKAIYEQRKDIAKMITHLSIEDLEAVVKAYEASYEDVDADAADEVDEPSAMSDSSGGFDAQEEKINQRLAEAVAGRK